MGYIFRPAVVPTENRYAIKTSQSLPSQSKTFASGLNIERGEKLFEWLKMN